MNFTCPLAKFIPYVDGIGKCAKEVCFKSMEETTEEADSLNEEVRDIPVATGGACQKRGHTHVAEWNNHCD